MSVSGQSEWCVLQSVTEGKIYVEIERARLTKRLARIKEEEGNIDEAADILQEVAVVSLQSLARCMRWQRHPYPTGLTSLAAHTLAGTLPSCISSICMKYSHREPLHAAGPAPHALGEIALTGDIRRDGEDREGRLHPGAGATYAAIHRAVCFLRACTSSRVYEGWQRHKGQAGASAMLLAKLLLAAVMGVIVRHVGPGHTFSFANDSMHTMELSPCHQGVSHRAHLEPFSTTLYAERVLCTYTCTSLLNAPMVCPEATALS